MKSLNYKLIKIMNFNYKKKVNLKVPTILQKKFNKRVVKIV